MAPKMIEKKESFCNIIAFFIFGFMDQFVFAILLAGAKDIDKGGVALVYLATAIPSFLTKLLLPYVADYISYNLRALMFGIVTCFGLLMVALASDLRVQLISVASCSVMTAMGESTAVALTSKYSRPATLLSAFSSGLGVAGVSAFGFVYIMENYISIDFSKVLMCIFYTPILFYISHCCILEKFPEQTPEISYSKVESEVHDNTRQDAEEDAEEEEYTGTESLLSEYITNRASKEERKTNQETTLNEEKTMIMVPSLESGITKGQSQLYLNEAHTIPNFEEEEEVNNGIDGLNGLSPKNSNFKVVQKNIPTIEGKKSFSKNNSAQSSCEKVFHTFGLTRGIFVFIIQMYIVYVCQYSLQSGIFSGIGFPITSEASRKKFYSLANWSFQIGLCIGRSSGNFLPRKRVEFLWLLALLQFFFLSLFSAIAITQYSFVYNFPSLLPVAFAVGLVGGMCYVNALTQVSALDYPSKEDQGTAISILCGSESLGCISADFLGLAIQGCLYRYNGIDGATFSCDIKI